MKAIFAVVALLAMVGCSMGLNPQPEPPAQIPSVLADLGVVTVNDGVMVIDLGNVPNMQRAVDQAVLVLQGLNSLGQLNIPDIALQVNGEVVPVTQEQLQDTVLKHVMPSYNQAFSGPYGFSGSNVEDNIMSGPFSQSTSNIEDNGREMRG